MFIPQQKPFVNRKFPCSGFGCLVNHSDLIPSFCVSCLQNDGKDPLPRHDTISGLSADGAVGVAFLADLRHLTQSGADPEPCSHRKGGKLYSFTENVFRESPRIQRERNLLLQTIDAFFRQQTYLSVPVAGMRVARNAMMRTHQDTVNRMLLLAFSFTDAYRTNDRLLIHSSNLLDKGI